MNRARFQISVIIPTLDEAARIAAHLGRVSALDGIHEVILTDSGSTDRTVEIARSIDGVKITAAPRTGGRAAGMNAGASEATGEVLLFLHADVTLPTDAAWHIEKVLADPAVVAGAFKTKTVPEESGLPLGRLLRLADIRSRYTHLPYGDQAMFVRTESFRRVGGFPDQPLMEDLELSRRLRRIGRIARVPANVEVSGRRFQARPILYTLMVNVYPLLYRLGIPPRLLARFYRHVR